MSETKERPQQEFRAGALKATIWRNDTEKGVMYSTTFSRVYKDGEDWKTSHSFRRDDLLVLARLAGQAFDYIVEQS